MTVLRGALSGLLAATFACSGGGGDVTSSPTETWAETATETWEETASPTEEAGTPTPTVTLTPTATATPTPTATDGETATPNPSCGESALDCGSTGQCVVDDGAEVCEYSLHGAVTYQRVQPICNDVVGEAVCDQGGCCLDPDPSHIQAFPVRNTSIWITNDDLGHVEAKVHTDMDGNWTATWLGESQVRVLVRTHAQNPGVVVVDNTNNGVFYQVLSPFTDAPTIDAAGESNYDIEIEAGWDGSDFAVRSAAPFAVLDSAFESAQFFLADRPDAAFPDLTLNWSINNDSCDGEYAEGCIGTSHWNGEELYILGKKDVDADEFDSHIIVHEWGHYFESALSRSDSVGGSHSGGDVKDLRLAFGEGWGNALGGLVFYPDSVYVDTYGSGQSSGFFNDVDDNSEGEDPYPGWFSEASVQAILFDLYDSGDDEAFDGVSLSAGTLFDIMTQGQKNVDAFTSIFSFIYEARLQAPDQAAAIDRFIEEAYDHAGSYGISKVVDALGTGEKHDGGWAENLQAGPGDTPTVIASLTPNSSAVTVSMRHEGDLEDTNNNWLSEHRYFVFEGDGALHSVRMQCGEGKDVDLHVRYRGAALGDRYLLGGEHDEEVELQTVDGNIYSAELVGWYFENNDAYTCDVWVQ